MQYTYDPEVEILYLLYMPEADARVQRTVEVTPRIHVDLDEHDRLVGVELLDARADMLALDHPVDVLNGS